MLLLIGSRGRSSGEIYGGLHGPETGLRCLVRDMGWSVKGWASAAKFAKPVVSVSRLAPREVACPAPALMSGGPVFVVRLLPAAGGADGRRMDWRATFRFH